MNKLKNQKGFTIIEVVLVLAIAGLIFLMVFIALPALQRSQRDTGKKQDISTVAAAVQDYMSNKGGSLPPSSAELQKFITKNMSQVDKKDATVDSKIGPTTVTPNEAQIIVVREAKCNTNPTKGNNTTIKGTKRNAAVIGKLEAGGDANYHCVEV